MNEISQQIIDEAWEVNKEMAGRLIVLNKFDVIGTGREYEATEVVAFLADRGITVETDNKFKVWLPSLKESLKQLFWKLQISSKTFPA